MRQRQGVLTRRLVLGATIPLLVGAQGTAALANVNPEFVYIGMHGDQIHVARFDPATGTLTASRPVASGLRPTWAVQHPVHPIVYWTDEAGNDGASEGGVVAFRPDRITGALERLGELRAGGGGTTHLSPATPTTLVATNYGGGSVATLTLATTGNLKSLGQVETSGGSGPHRRQAAPHPHGSVVDPSGRFILVADLGADRVFILPFDRRTGRLGALNPDDGRHYVVAPGSGPRHISFHRNGRVLYLINELTAEIQILSWDRRAGRLTLVQTISINDPGFSGQSSGGEIAVSRDGRFVYASNRGDNSLVIHAVDQRTGRLTRIQKLPSGGEKPWHFAIHPGGSWLLCANRDANAVRVFAVDRRSGRLSDTGASLATPTPVHVHFLER